MQRKEIGYAMLVALSVVLTLVVLFTIAYAFTQPQGWIPGTIASILLVWVGLALYLVR